MDGRDDAVPVHNRSVQQRWVFIYRGRRKMSMIAAGSLAMLQYFSIRHSFSAFTMLMIIQKNEPLSLA